MCFILHSKNNLKERMEEHGAHLPMGHLSLGRAPLRLQWSAVSRGVFRQMWRAACDQCHCNFSLVIMWRRTRLIDALLAGAA